VLPGLDGFSRDISSDVALPHGLGVVARDSSKGKLLSLKHSLKHFIVLRVILVHIPSQVDINFTALHIGG
jgi:hypothetical protein